MKRLFFANSTRNRFVEALTFKLDLKKCTGFPMVQLGEGHYRGESREEEVIFKEL